MPSTAAMHKRGFSSALTDRAPSPNIWSDCPFETIEQARIPGKAIWDDFLNTPTLSADQSIGKYDTFGTTGVAFRAYQGAEYGGIEVYGNDAENDEGVLSTHGPVANISDTAGDDKKLWFEARISKSDIATNSLGMFIGLAYDDDSSVTVAKAACLADSTMNLGVFSYIGFHVDEAGPATLDFVYQTEAGSQTVLIAGVHTLAVDTFVKVGFKYDPLAPAAKRIAVYVNNVEQSTYVTSTLIAAAAFPDAEDLGMVWATKNRNNATTAAILAQVDWWRFAQLS